MRFELREVFGFPHRRFVAVTVGRWEFDFFDWSLSRRLIAPAYQSMGWFSLRCVTCRRWSLGCSERGLRHLFCGLCRACDIRIATEVA